MIVRAGYRPRWRLGAVLLVLAGLLFFAVTSTRLVMNGSHSLPHNGYLMFSWPLIITRNSYVAAQVPAAYAEDLEGLVFVKRIVGLPGDILRHEDGALCVRTECFPAAQTGGAPFDALTAEGPIPAGFYAAFADAPDSLDSRYASVGLFARADILAAGWPIPIPHWMEVKAWLDR